MFVVHASYDAAHILTDRMIHDFEDGVENACSLKIYIGGDAEGRVRRGCVAVNRRSPFIVPTR